MVDLEREFQSPSSGFRGVPFWAWNGKLEKDTLQEQVSVFQKMGFGGFHIHVRTGLDDQYLGTEYMEAVSTVVEKAKECELKAWLYDEDRWASGAAGGFVTKEQKYRQKYLLFTPFSYDEVGPSAPPRGFLFPHMMICQPLKFIWLMWDCFADWPFLLLLHLVKATDYLQNSKAH